MQALLKRIYKGRQPAWMKDMVATPLITYEIRKYSPAADH
jgi:hypothetical protein